MKKILNMKSKNKVILIILFFCVFFLSFIISNFVFSGDEIWCYGFSYNFYKGMVPYVDFNMIVPPLYCFCGSIFIWMFGEYLFSLHIFNAFLIGGVIVLLYRCIGIKCLLLLPALLVFNLPTYNYLCLFFEFLIIYLISNEKDNDWLMGFVVSFMFLTKQSIGLVMVIPLLFYSKNKLKSMLAFLIPLLILFIYLIFNDALYGFLDYCFLGMLDFNNNNMEFSIFTFLAIIQVVFIVGCLVNCKFRNKILFYILMFQVMSYPIFDIVHWFWAFIPLLYYLISKINIKRIRYYLEFLKILFVIVVIVLCLGVLFTYLVKDKEFYKNNNNYFYMRNIYGTNLKGLDEQKLIVDKYVGNDNELFFVMNNVYLLKLYLNISINKFDLINNGNMGYTGSSGYIEEISNICNNKKCIFFVEDIDFDNVYCQISQEIYDYVIDNYSLLNSYEYFRVYGN